MRREIAAPSVYHQARLERTAPFVQDDGVVFAAQMPRKHFPLNENGIPSTPLNAYLYRLGLEHVQVGKVLTPESKVIPITTEPFNLTEYRPEEVRDYFLGNAEFIMSLINRSMAGPEKRQVKNSHDVAHAMTVSSYALSLAKGVLSPVFDREALQAGAAAYVLHDVGNLIGREDHPCFSVRLARLLYPNLIMTDKQAEIFDKTTLLHDGDDIKNLFKSWGRVNAQQAVEKLAEFGPVPLALIVADKAGDVGISRLPTGRHLHPRDYQDPHRFINLFWETDYLGFGKDDTGAEDESQLEMQFAFGREIPPEVAAQIPMFVKETRDGYERKTPKAVRDSKRTLTPMSTYEHLLRGFWSEYYPRMMLAVMASFAMNPILQETRIIMHDVNDPDNRNVRRFRRNRLARDMWEAYKELVPADKRGIQDYEQYAEFARIERVAT